MSSSSEATPAVVAATTSVAPTRSAVPPQPNKFIGFIKVPTTAGIIGGSCGLIVGYPFDVMKTFAQTEHSRNIFHSTQMIYQRFGLRGFFNGLMPPLLTRSLVKGTLFSAYDFAHKELEQRQYFGNGTTTGTYINLTVAGGIGGLANAFVSSPVELIKIYEQKGILFRDILKDLRVNWSMLWKGLPQTISREVPFFSIYFPLYRYCKDIDLPLAGGIAGTVPWAVVYPLDVIKTATQAPGKNLSSVKAIYAAYGVRGFYHGLTATVLRAFPVHLVTLAVYDALITL